MLDSMRRGTRLTLVLRLFVGLVALVATGCVDEPLPRGGEETAEDYGIEGPFAVDGPNGKGDDAGVPGPKVSTYTGDTQVWTARNAWEDTETAAARAGGIAWPANSGLSWDDKFALWIDSMTRIDGHDTYYETFTLTTPWGKEVPAPKLECAEMAIFLRVTFAAWYELPFYMTAVDGEGTRVFFGHFGARTVSQRYKNTPKYAQYFADYSDWSASKLEAEGWPRDEKLRSRGLYGGGDDMPFIEEGARAGAYFDEIHLNKRAGHFMRLILAYFGSMHLAGSRNTYNLAPEAVREGDVLVERWQRRGIGHTLVVKSVETLAEGGLEAQVVSGSMPRRQPKWESGVASKGYFTDERTGGEGANSSGEEYVKLGGGLKRFRVTKNINGYWTNTWMSADEASWISDTDFEALAARPGRFESLLGEVTPEQKRGALLEVIEDARNHLRQYPASCSARIKREDAFTDLYLLMEDEFETDEAATDAQYRIFEDYVFQRLEYEQSKTCCWNSSTAAMHQIAVEYNQSLQDEAAAQMQCVEPVVFKASDGGYQAFADYAAATERSHLWKPWSADETCPQAGSIDDVVVAHEGAAWCDLDGDPGEVEGCLPDAYEDNDAAPQAATLSSGSFPELSICGGDDDYYAIDISPGQTLTATIAFDHDEGDLDLVLQRDGDEVDSSMSVSSTETVSDTQGGSYVIRVYGYNGAEAEYDLTLSVQ